MPDTSAGIMVDASDKIRFCLVLLAGSTMLKWLCSKFQTARPDQDQAAACAATVTSASAAHWRKEGNVFLGNSNWLEAERCYRNGILADPADAACYANLGYVLLQTGRAEEAQRMLSHAVDHNPADFDAHFLLGNLARERGDSQHAIACFESALRNKPDFDFCRRDLCLLLAQAGRPQEACTLMEQGATFDTDSADYYLFKGNLHFAMAQYETAVDLFKKAKVLKPGDPATLINLGAAQIGQLDVLTAIDTYREVLELDPNSVQAHANMAAALQLSGQLDLAVLSYREALRVDPNYLQAHQNLLYVLSQLADCSPAAYLEEARLYGTKVGHLATPYTQWGCIPRLAVTRPLRVGFVSGDLRMHPVGYFLANILTHMDPSKITCIAYSTNTTEDALSMRLKASFAHWNQVANLTDASLAHRIHSDKVDILVDLAGHTANNRLSLFAWRPAPVQVSWLGYWASTGVAAVDHILVDKASVPPNKDTHFSETPWYLPDTRLCLSPPTAATARVSGFLPALRNGHVTFGSFQALSKVNDTTLALWSRVLAQLPTARLRLQSVPLGYPACVADTKRRLSLAQIDIDRVDLHGGVSRDAYLDAYAEVDVILDTFPFPGGTTTAEALWMGVPTVTLSGNTLLGRQGQSLLVCAGLADWVAHTEQEYVQLAVEKVGDLSQLAKLRAGLRTTVSTSPLFDAATFARNLEAAFEEMDNLKNVEPMRPLH